MTEVSSLYVMCHTDIHVYSVDSLNALENVLAPASPHRYEGLRLLLHGQIAQGCNEAQSMQHDWLQCNTTDHTLLQSKPLLKVVSVAHMAKKLVGITSELLAAGCFNRLQICGMNRLICLSNNCSDVLYVIQC